MIPVTFWSFPLCGSGRQEKAAWERQSSSVKEQCLVAMAEKEKQLSHLRGIVQERSVPLGTSQAVAEQHPAKVGARTVPLLPGNVRFEIQSKQRVPLVSSLYRLQYRVLM